MSREAWCILVAPAKTLSSPVARSLLGAIGTGHVEGPPFFWLPAASVLRKWREERRSEYSLPWPPSPRSACAAFWFKWRSCPLVSQHSPRWFCFWQMPPWPFQPRGSNSVPGLTLGDEKGEVLSAITRVSASSCLETSSVSCWNPVLLTRNTPALLRHLLNSHVCIICKQGINYFHSKWLK